MTTAVSLEQVRRITIACHRRLGQPLDRVELEDAIQEATIAAWRRDSQFAGRSSRETWLYGVARIAILDQARKRRRAQACLAALEDRDPRRPPTEPDARLETAIVIAVNACLRALGTTEACILKRRLSDDESFLEIAQGSALAEPAVKARFYRALPEARRRLERWWRLVSGS